MLKITYKISFALTSIQQEPYYFKVNAYVLELK